MERVANRVHQGWRSIFLVLRPQSLSLYKNENESQLRHKVQLSDLTAVALLKDPKHKRHNVFGLFSPSRNYHLEAATLKDAQEWVDMIRREARIEEEEEELYLASPGGTTSRSCLDFHKANGGKSDAAQMAEERIGSSSPEPLHLPQPMGAGRPSDQRRPSQTMDYSGNDMSDMSDNDLTRAAGIFSTSIPNDTVPARPKTDPATANMSDLERVIWQGHLLYLKSSAGVRQWKNLWVVARQRNIALYKNDAEYTLLKIIPIDSIINVVEVDPLSKTKKHCLQIITEERSYKFCAHNEAEWDQSLGAFKSLLARRKGETRTQS